MKSNQHYKAKRSARKLAVNTWDEVLIITGTLDSGADPTYNNSIVGLRHIKTSTDTVATASNIETASKEGTMDYAPEGAHGELFPMKTLVVDTFDEALLSVSELARSNITSVFDDKGYKLCRSNQVVITGSPLSEGPMIGRQYKINIPILNPNYNLHYSAHQARCHPNDPEGDQLAEILHLRFMHLNRELCHRVISGGMYEGRCIFKDIVCKSCVQGKCRRHPHISIPKEQRVVTLLGTAMSSDILHGGPIKSLNGASYHEFFIEEHSGAVVIESLQRKSNHTEATARAIHTFQSESGVKIRFHRTDACGTMRSKSIKRFHYSNGIKFVKSGAHDSNSSGRIDRIMQTLEDCCCATMIHAHAPPTFAGECLNWCADTWNILPTVPNNSGGTKYISRAMIDPR